MAEIHGDMLAHISRRNGEMTALLARYRDVETQITTLGAVTDVAMAVIVPAASGQFSMMVPTETLRAQHEALLSTLGTRILDCAGRPMDDMPPPAAAEPEQAAAPIPITAAPEGDHPPG